MSRLPNTTQYQEMESLLHKANKIAKHYERVTNCSVSVMRPDYLSLPDKGSSRSECSVKMNKLNFFCRHCLGKINNNGRKICALMHIDAVKKAKKLGGANIYLCEKGFVFWTSPFYLGEHLAGALVSGGIAYSGSDHKSIQSNNRIKALVSMMLICADQISRMSFTQKNINAASAESNEADTGNNVQNDNIVYFIDMERMLLAYLRRGDNDKAEELIMKLLNTKDKEVKQDILAFRLKAMELAVLLSRATSDPNDINDDSVIEANSNFLKRIVESQDHEEIEKIVLDVAEKMSGKIFSFQGVQHFTALRNADRFIWDNYTRKIGLQEVAKASGLSSPYFCMIFKEEMGETLSDYLNRLRMEKAAIMLLKTYLPINEIAKSCGFVDQSWFSKIFKNNTGLTPGKFRYQGSFSKNNFVRGLTV